ncbi:MAG: hypothetical protein MGF17_04045 [Trichodesmium sp. MAG_R04]|nr:hypothetical protein [Trichodesmium sp. MAG_R04]
MTTNKKNTENFSNTRLKEPIYIDSLAENLMEDLFHDIDKVLNGGSRSPTEVTQPEMVSLTPIKIPQIVLSEEKTQFQDAEKEEKVQLAEAQVEKKENQSLDKLLLGAAFASILVTLSLWLATRGGFDKVLGYLGYIEKRDSSVEKLSPKAVTDAKFADYIQRSLKMIEQKKATEKRQQIPGVPTAPSSHNLPTLPVPANPPINTSLLLPLNRLVDLMEAQVAKKTLTIPKTKVVVIPPIPTAVAVTPKSEVPSPKLSAASASKASTEAADSVQKKSEAEVTVKTEVKPRINHSSSEKAEVKAKLKPPTKTTAQAKPENNSELKLEAKPKIEIPTQSVLLPPPIPVKIPEIKTVVPNQIQTSINTLVGVLELGERSAALFEIDGVARRIYVGEKIGTSGWTLVKVVNQEAVIRRNGEVRSVFVGQQF